MSAPVVGPLMRGPWRVLIGVTHLGVAVTNNGARVTHG